MSSTLAKIAEIEAEMARTQKNKATAHHLGLLKARLAKLRRELITPKGGGGGGPGEGLCFSSIYILLGIILVKKYIHVV
uniref:Developmentally regulated GTP binding protein 1 n=1 Tax=Papio anubis TaxID=9555 RepID=A0A8I5NE50_PAPAN